MHRDSLGFFEVCQEEGRGFESHPSPIFFAGYFGFVRLFLKFFKCLHSVPLHFFSILQKNRYSKTPQGPPFTIFGTMRLTGDQKIFQKIFSSYRKRRYLRKEYLKLSSPFAIFEPQIWRRRGSRLVSTIRYHGSSSSPPS